LEISQRAIVENVLREHLGAFVDEELLRLNEAGVISGGELARRRRQLAEPIEHWTPPERGRGAASHRSGLNRLWQLLLGEENE